MSIQLVLAAIEQWVESVRDRFDTVTPDGSAAAMLQGKTLVQIEADYGFAIALATQAVADAIGTFAARRDNPHQVDADQVGLGDVANYPVADQFTAEQGASAAHYMTPIAMSQQWAANWVIAIGAAPEELDTIEELAAALQNNPDIITDIMDAVGSLYSSTAKVADTERLDGYTAAEFVAEVLTNTFNNTLLLAGRTRAELTASHAQIDVGDATDVWVSPAGVNYGIGSIQSQLLQNTYLMEHALDELTTAIQAYVSGGGGSTPTETVLAMAWSEFNKTGTDITLSDNNQTATSAAPGTGSWHGAVAQSYNAKQAGRWYVEFHIVNPGDDNFNTVGIAPAEINPALSTGSSAVGYNLSRHGQYYNANALLDLNAAWVEGDVIGFAVDIGTTGSVTIYRNGVQIHYAVTNFFSQSVSHWFVPRMNARWQGGARMSVRVVTLADELTYPAPAGYQPWSYTVDPNRPGDPTDGGYYVGKLCDNGQWYRIIVAGKAGEAVSAIKTENTDTPNTSDVGNGMANTLAMLADDPAKHPAAALISSYTFGGYNDWYIGSMAEVQLMYDVLGVQGAYRLEPGYVIPPAFVYNAGGDERITLNQSSSTQDTAQAGRVYDIGSLASAARQAFASITKSTINIGPRPIRRVPTDPVYTTMEWSLHQKPADIIVSNGNRTAISTTATDRTIAANLKAGKTTGRWYCEFIIHQSRNDFSGVGITSTNVNTTSILGGSGSDGCYTCSGSFYSTSITALGQPYISGDIVGMAVDVDARTVSFYRNGVLVTTQTRSSWVVNTPRIPAMTAQGPDFEVELVTHPSALTYAPPSGYLPWAHTASDDGPSAR